MINFSILRTIRIFIIASMPSPSPFPPQGKRVRHYPPCTRFLGDGPKIDAIVARIKAYCIGNVYIAAHGTIRADAKLWTSNFCGNWLSMQGRNSRTAPGSYAVFNDAAVMVVASVMVLGSPAPVDKKNNLCHYFHSA